MAPRRTILAIAVVGCVSCSSEGVEGDNSTWSLAEPERASLDMSTRVLDQGSSSREDFSDSSDMAAVDSGSDARPSLPGEPCVVDGARGRCSIGLRYPGMAADECAAIYKPMPELCNGMDDDCDGITDPEDMSAGFRERWEDVLLERGVSRDDVSRALSLACLPDNPCAAQDEVGKDIYEHQPPPEMFVEEVERFIEHSYSLGLCLTD